MYDDDDDPRFTDDKLTKTEAAIAVAFCIAALAGIYALL